MHGPVFHAQRPLQRCLRAPPPKRLRMKVIDRHHFLQRSMRDDDALVSKRGDTVGQTGQGIEIVGNQ